LGEDYGSSGISVGRAIMGGCRIEISTQPFWAFVLLGGSGRWN
jgi:hypothetical protein